MKKHCITNRCIPLLMTALLLFSAAGCGKDSGSEGAVSQNTSSGQPQSGGEAGGGTDASNAYDPFGKYDETLEFTCSRYVQTNSNLPQGDTYEDNAYTRYLLNRINAKLVTGFEAPGGDDYDRQISLAITSGDIPDIMTVTSVSVFRELLDNDLIADLTDAYQNYASPNLRATYETYGDRALAKATVDDRLMALTDGMGDGAPQIIWVREDWLNEVNLGSIGGADQVLSLEDLENIVRTFMKEDPGKTGNPVGMSFEDSVNVTNYGGAHNALAINSIFNAYPKLWIKDSAGKVTYGSIQPETKAALQKLNEWYKEGLLDPQIGTRTWDEIGALLINNQMGVVFGAWHISDWLLTGVREMNPQAAFKCFTLKDEKGKVNVFHTNAVNRYIVVRKDFGNPELAVKIANIFYDELTGTITDPDILKYQEIGVDNSTKPLFMELGPSDGLVEEYEQIRAVVKDGAAMDIIPSTGNRTIAELCIAYEKDPSAADTTTWARYHSRMKGIEITKQMYDKDYFSWIDPVFWGSTSTMEQRMSNLDILEEETFIKIITGAEPVDSFDTFVNTWKAEGGDIILSEIEQEISQ